MNKALRGVVFFSLIAASVASAERVKYRVYSCEFADKARTKYFKVQDYFLKIADRAAADADHALFDTKSTSDKWNVKANQVPVRVNDVAYQLWPQYEAGSPGREGYKQFRYTEVIREPQEGMPYWKSAFGLLVPPALYEGEEKTGDIWVFERQSDSYNEYRLSCALVPGRFK